MEADARRNQLEKPVPRLSQGKGRGRQGAAGLRNEPEQLFDYLNCGRAALIKRKTKLKRYTNILSPSFREKGNMLPFKRSDDPASAMCP